jgi:uncharacterized protein YjbJ (UPF0337 family)
VCKSEQYESKQSDFLTGISQRQPRSGCERSASKLLRDGKAPARRVTPRNDRTGSPLSPHVYNGRMTDMDREHVKGAADKAKGAIKEGAGKLTDDKSLETEGKMDKAKGSAHNAAGDVKEGLRDAADAVKK